MERDGETGLALHGARYYAPWLGRWTSGYVASERIPELQREGIGLVSKSWTSTNKGRFTKRDFHFNLRDKTVTCPAGQSQRYELGRTTQFDDANHSACELRSHCTARPDGRGRSMQIHPQEELQERFRRMAASKKGRARQRERVPVEHRLAISTTSAATPP